MLRVISKYDKKTNWQVWSDSNYIVHENHVSNVEAICRHTFSSGSTIVDGDPIGTRLLRREKYYTYGLTLAKFYLISKTIFVENFASKIVLKVYDLRPQWVNLPANREKYVIFPFNYFSRPMNRIRLTLGYP